MDSLRKAPLFQNKNKSERYIENYEENIFMNVVFIGTLDAEGTGLARLKALESFGTGDVFPFDSDHFFAKPLKFQWLNRIDYSLLLSSRYRKCNRALLQFCEKIKPDIIWVDKGFWVWPSTLKMLRKRGVFLVHHNTDSLNPEKWYVKLAYRLMRRTLPLFDLYFTTNLQDYRALSEKTKPQTNLTHIGYDHTRFNNSPILTSIKEQWNNELLFVGHYEKRTCDGIIALIENGLAIAVYGAGWNHAEEYDKLRDHVNFRRLNNEEYLYALKSAKIGLCFVSQLNGNQTAGRSFEIPACGTFLLAMRTNQHMDCYLEGTEAEFFSNNQELVQKARYYLEHDDRRKEIAHRGFQRCTGSDYSWSRYMHDDWDKVCKALEKRKNGYIA